MRQALGRVTGVGRLRRRADARSVPVGLGLLAASSSWHNLWNLCSVWSIPSQWVRRRPRAESVHRHRA
jgi:hypothetical protein